MASRSDNKSRPKRKSRPRKPKLPARRPPVAKRQPRRARRSKLRTAGQLVTAPATMGFVTSQRDFKAGMARQTGVFKDPEVGECVRIEAHVILCSISSGSGNPGIPFFYPTGAFANRLCGSGFTDATTPTHYTGIYLMPQYLAGRLQNQTGMYQWYRIRKVSLFYSPSTASSVTGQLHLGLTRDPVPVPESSADGKTFNISSLSQTDCYMSTPVWQAAEIGCEYKGSKWFSTASLSVVGDSDSTNAANLRQICQFRLAGGMLNTTASVNYGELNCSFIIELAGPIPNTGDWVGPIGSISATHTDTVPSMDTDVFLRRPPRTSQSLLELCRRLQGSTLSEDVKVETTRGAGTVTPDDFEKEFDSTRGYPGEGPFFVEAKDALQWARKYESCDLSDEKCRKRLLAELSSVIRTSPCKGVTCVKIPDSTYAAFVKAANVVVGYLKDYSYLTKLVISVAQVATSLM